MVMVTHNESNATGAVPSLDVFDDAGHRLGIIRLPVGSYVAGPRAGTVLLRRNVPMPPTRASNQRLR